MSEAAKFTPFSIAVDTEEKANLLAQVIDAANRFYATQAGPSIVGSSKAIMAHRLVFGAQQIAQVAAGSVKPLGPLHRPGKRPGNGKHAV